MHVSSGGLDGFVSVEVAPALAHDTNGTVAAAKYLHGRIARPNLLVKIPATIEGIPAIEESIASGISVNVTLIFGLERYEAVMDAYIAGLRRLLDSGVHDLSMMQGVASFFVSRVDTEVDRRLEDIASACHSTASPEILAFRGKAAVAQAQVAYDMFCSKFSGPGWEVLANAGAIAQRPLWASTSTKNPSYPDLLYVDSLIGPQTVNAMPDQTVEAFLDHGTVVRTVDADAGSAREVLSALDEFGVNMAEVAKVLEDEGVSSFSKSFDELLQALSDKASILKGSR